MSTQSQKKEVTVNGKLYKISGRAWWTDAALDKGDGRIEVARIDAWSTTLRLPSEAQLAAEPSLNRYWQDESNQGRYVAYMLGLTEDDLESLDMTPGIINSPYVVDGPRPAGNRTDRPSTMRQMQQVQDWLQNDCIGRPSAY